MANEKLKSVRGAPGLFVNPRGQYHLAVTAKSEKTGKLRKARRTLSLGTTKAEALRVLAELKVGLAAGEPLQQRPTADVPTVRAYATLWGERQLARGKWNPHGGTAEAVGYRLDRYVMPRFGDYLVDRISSPDIEAWLDWMATQVGVRTTRATYGHLRGVVREARKGLGLPPLDFPPAPVAPKDGKDVPLTWDNYDRDNGLALTRDQLTIFFDAAKASSPSGWYPMCLLGFASGARFSELTTARAGDFRLDDEIGVWLCRQHLVAARRSSEPGTKWNPRGKVNLIDAHSTRLLRPILAGKAEDELVFPSKQATTPYRTGKGLQWFLDAVSRATGLPQMTSKVFRQTYLTLSHLESMADAMSQAQAGHTDPKTTMAYVKPSMGHRKEHARKMAGVLHLVDDGDDGDE